MASSDLFNTEAEALLLAAFLKYPDDFWSLNEVGLTPKDFLGPMNIRVMRAISRVVENKKPPALPLVVEALQAADEDEAIEYAETLVTLSVSVPQAVEMAATVKGLAASRSLAEAGADIIRIAREKRADYDGAVSEAERLLREVRNTLPLDRRSADPADILARLDNGYRENRLPLYFLPTLNELTSGFVPGEMWVIGGYSSVGKSAIAANIICDQIRTNAHTLLFSTEMTSEAYLIRVLAILSGVEQRKIRDRVLLPTDDHESYHRARSLVSRSNLRVFDTVYRLNAIRSKAMRMKETTGLDLVLVDFIQNVYVTGDEVDDARIAAKDLQLLGKELDCTVITFSQLSNQQAMYDAEGGDDNVYAYKGSGAIKDAGDVNLMARRDRGSPILKLKLMKNRSGEAGAVISCVIDLPTGRIREGRIDDEE